MNKVLIKNARVVCPDEILENASLLVVDGRIADFGEVKETPDDTEIIDAHGTYLLPAFIELHAHGGGGYDFADMSKDAFDSVMKTHLLHGVSLLCPTLVACKWEKTMDFLRFCDEYEKGSPMFGGVHLEGPFLSPVMCGAQKPGSIIEPDGRKISELAEFSQLISCITAAPEISGTEQLAKALAPKGVAMSVGHSNADANEMKKAAEWGFSRVTHLFCSTSRRAKQGSFVIGGIEEQALIDDRFTVELIGDGHHISRESFLLTMKCKGRDRLAVVSDAMRAAGQSEVTESFLGELCPENRVLIEDGVAKLTDRSSFAGSVAVGDTMVQALCGKYGLPLCEVSYMMSAVPARLLGLSDTGMIKRGYKAELILLDHNFKTKRVLSDCASRYGI